MTDIQVCPAAEHSDRSKDLSLHLYSLAGSVGARRRLPRRFAPRNDRKDKADFKGKYWCNAEVATFFCGRTRNDRERLTLRTQIVNN